MPASKRAAPVRRPAKRGPAADATRDRLTSLAHELRNPLAAVRNAARLLTDARDPAVAAEARGIIETETARMLVLVDALVGEASAAPGRTLPRRSRSPAKRHVLIVDDDPHSARTMQLMLARRGHSARIVHRGDEALDAALESMPRAVLLDIALSDTDGYKVARALRAQVVLDRTLIVATTGFGAERDRRRAQRAGIDAHLTKPIDLDELLELLARGRP